MTETPAPHDPTSPSGPPPPPAGSPGPETVPGPAPTPTRDHQDPLRGSRTSGAWAGVIAAAVLLILLIVFIAQNTESTDIEFLGFDGSLPLAVALLIATVVGMVVAGAVGSLRILQLRRRIKRDRKG
ncbi:lipopolysaccharide assembly protein LapA domain-containing protein [Nocardioides sp. 1609]|uniref:LapA family protein n=1 Tax=Nocardioides sp. 1609 TaxID=2508327 RepID=UPI0010703CD9|nr:lipopolysaccharide assembly protein LapA domain-containing protein [Nocardioides sp. 1609]